MTKTKTKDRMPLKLQRALRCWLSGQGACPGMVDRAMRFAVRFRTLRAALQATTQNRRDGEYFLWWLAVKCLNPDFRERLGNRVDRQIAHPTRQKGWERLPSRQQTRQLERYWRERDTLYQQLRLTALQQALPELLGLNQKLPGKKLLDMLPLSHRLAVQQVRAAQAGVA